MPLPPRLHFFFFFFFHIISLLCRFDYFRHFDARAIMLRFASILRRRRYDAMLPRHAMIFAAYATLRCFS